MIWTETTVKVSCDVCGITAADDLHERRYALTEFRARGWSIGMEKHLCPECKIKRIEAVTKARAIKKGMKA